MEILSQEKICIVLCHVQTGTLCTAFNMGTPSLQSRDSSPPMFLTYLRSRARKSESGDAFVRMLHVNGVSVRMLHVNSVSVRMLHVNSVSVRMLHVNNMCVRWPCTLPMVPERSALFFQWKCCMPLLCYPFRASLHLSVCINTQSLEAYSQLWPTRVSTKQRGWISCGIIEVCITHVCEYIIKTMEHIIL